MDLWINREGDGNTAVTSNQCSEDAGSELENCLNARMHKMNEDFKNKIEEIEGKTNEKI